MASPKERKEAPERAVRRRLKWTAAYREVGDAGAVCRRFGISRPTPRKWLRRFEADGEAGLSEPSRRPHSSPAKRVSAEAEERILALRRERRLGVKRIRAELRRLHDVQLSPSVIHKVLVRHGLNVLPRRERARRRPRRHSRPVPGDRAQVDVRKIRPGLHQFAAIGDCSRYLVAGLSRRPSAAAALAFLDRVLEEMPFAIQRIQTDRGAEFFAEEVQRRLVAETIKFRPIPPRSPHLNGKAERAQRTVVEESWPTVEARAPDVGDQLAVWVHHHDRDRPHEGLGGLRPIDRACERLDKTPIWAEVDDAYDTARERIQVREYAVGMALRRLK